MEACVVTVEYAATRRGTELMDNVVLSVIYLCVIGVLMFLRENDKTAFAKERSQLLDRLMSKNFGEYYAIKTAGELPPVVNEEVQTTSDYDGAWAK